MVMFCLLVMLWIASIVLASEATMFYTRRSLPFAAWVCRYFGHRPYKLVRRFCTRCARWQEKAPRRTIVR